jgi:hypothetical protein
VLGFIPGVGAMYNGQFVKGMIHVLVFVILIAMANREGVFGILIAAWIAYQVFDAYQTAKAKREGLPLPDPFGLNDLGGKLGVPPHGAAQGFVGTQTPQTPPGPEYSPAAGYTNPYTAAAPYCASPRRREPVGALVLIGLGVLFLLNSMNIFHFDWIGRLWPVLIIGIGVALFIRRTRELPPPPPPPGAGGPQ